MKTTVQTNSGSERSIPYAILTAEEAIWVSTLANSYYATALAKAHNDWLIDTWLKKDKRLKFKGHEFHFSTFLKNKEFPIAEAINKTQNIQQ